MDAQHGEMAPSREMVSGQRLEEVGDDYFTASRQRPKGTFYYYWVDVTVNTQDDKSVLPTNSTLALTSPSWCVRTGMALPNKARLELYTLGGIFITGGAPEDFDVDATASSTTTSQLSLHLSQVRQCLKAKCYIRILERSRPILFPCHDYVGKERTLTFSNIVRRRAYVVHIVLVNSHNEKNATKAVPFRIP
ncbi:hypothetical protein V5799_025873 [Amblyomma americanum]|uniref:Uncharacterized protein n=1 Tax=Amblyomma americanum TaxID=6943 RepID=A0AAQ4E893_AMBAM